MLVNNESMKLPAYRDFVDSISELNLPISSSELHGVMCGYLIGGESRQGEGYLRALTLNRSEINAREVARVLFEVYAVSQQQITNFGFELQLLLPNDDEPLYERARAFSEWCEGFIQGITVSGVDMHALKSEDAQEVIQHISEFSALDYDALEVNEGDERALMEVIEYTRVAVLHIYTDIQSGESGSSEIAH